MKPEARSGVLNLKPGDDFVNLKFIERMQGGYGLNYVCMDLFQALY